MKEITIKVTENELENLIDSVVEMRQRVREDDFPDMEKELVDLFYKLCKTRAWHHRETYQD